MSSPLFILSTGRTGTQFFEEYFNQTAPGAYCLHEPAPSRRFKFLSNLYLAGKVDPAFITRVYRFSRRSIMRRAGDRIYIESSNFLFGCIPALKEEFPDLGVIHIIRHPVSYVKSHLGHGFWKGHKKFFARYVPYWIENLDVKDPSDPLEILAARWNYVNREIAGYERSVRYAAFQFEELFSGNLEMASQRLNLIREFCGLTPLSFEENTGWLQRPKNVSRNPVQLTDKEQDRVLSMTGDLRRTYGYPE